MICDLAKAFVCVNYKILLVLNILNMVYTFHFFLFKMQFVS